MSDERRFQIHLSTAIVVMFFAGGIMWINTSLSAGKIYHRRVAVMYKVGNKSVSPEKIEIGGWPVAFYERTTLKDAGAYTEVQGELCILNVIVNLVILLAVASGCEWFIRQRVLD